MFRPPSLLAPQIVPTAAHTPAGQPGLLRPGLSCSLPRSGYASRPNTGNWRYRDLHPVRFSALSAAHFAPRALPRFITTKEQSAPLRRIGTFSLAVVAACAFSLGIADQVLTFRTRARLSFAPPTCRMPLGQSQCIPPSLSRKIGQPPVLTSS